MGYIIDNHNMHFKFKNILNQKYKFETLDGTSVEKTLFVDKSNIINDFNKLINRDNEKYICITKPRRFGKTSIAAMLVTYYSKGIESKYIFDKLKVSKGKSSKEEDKNLEKEQYNEFQNKYHTLYFDFSYGVDSYRTLDEYLASINNDLKDDIKILFPNSKILNNYKNQIYKNLESLNIELNEQFILIIDEWDYIITSKKFSSSERNNYISFLKYLIKDKAYLAFTYMTGITPISKQLSQSTINCFNEYSMLNDEVYYQYFGFTEKEVRDLCKNNKTITYEKLEDWYNGYKGPNGEKIFNTWSVCQALTENNICNYWTNTGRYDELKIIINFNINGIKDEILELIRGKNLPQEVHIYGAEDQQRESEENENNSKNDLKEELYSKMITYGFLSYYNGEISIPNKEILEKFKKLLKQDSDLEYYYNMINNSDKMIKATFNKNTTEMCKILKNSHLIKIMPGDKIDHGNLKRVIDFVYFNIRMNYIVKEEEKAGEGIADYIYYPKDKKEVVIIMELKTDQLATAAIKQIHDKKYYNNLRNQEYKGNILLVGIGYKNQNKTYSCMIEELDYDLKPIIPSESISETPSELSSKSLNKRKRISDYGMSKRLRSSDKKQKKKK